MNDTFEVQKSMIDEALTKLKLIGYICEGAMEHEIQQLMEHQQVKTLPNIYVYFLKKAGKWIGRKPRPNHGGGYWNIIDHYLIDNLLEDGNWIKPSMQEEMIEKEIDFTLPEDYFVWGMHGGYRYLFFQHTTPENLDAWIWDTVDLEPEKLYYGLAGFIAYWVNWMVEKGY